MKVFIKSEKNNISIILPTALLLNRLTAVIIFKVIKSKQPSINIGAKDFMKLMNSIKKYKQRHKSWDVVSISSTDGKNVFISL